MVRQIIAVLFMVIWCCQLSSRYFVMLDFYMNREAIAAELCVNKDKPEMHCNGSCALKAKLQQEERKEHENPERKAENKSEVLFLAATELHRVVCPDTNGASIHAHPQMIGIPVDRTYSIFHPPTA